MNIDKIKAIVNSSGLSKEQMHRLICTEIALSENAAGDIIEILGAQRNIYRNLTSDMNLEVSRYHIHINTPALLRKNKDFLNEETKTLYKKWVDFIKPCFNNKFD